MLDDPVLGRVFEGIQVGKPLPAGSEPLMIYSNRQLYHLVESVACDASVEGEECYSRR